MTQFPTVKTKKLIKVLRKLDFQFVRQKGSHCFYRHYDERTTVIPIHSNEDIGRGLLLEILKDIEISPEEFLKLL